MGDEVKKYQIIYADPPWRYEFSPSKNRNIENKYPTMDLKDICSLPVGGVIDENCVLYLWATAPKLLEALLVMSSWGFTYRTCMVWDKKIIGMGRWFRGQHELVLPGLKGKIHTPPPPPQRISSIYQEKRTKHSKKPDYIRNKILEWYPDKNKIELFARQKTEGWDCIGNGINGKDIKQELEEMING
jgi:N6-adenosine-specific RNA methylase IME4